MRKSVLTVTDLTERSDAAVVWADTIARRRGWDLHVAHAVALADRERGTDHAQLRQLERAIVVADAASRAQMQRTIGRPRTLPTRVIDLDGVVPALLRRATHLAPDLVVIAAGWPWSMNDSRPEALSADKVARLGTNLLVVREPLPPDACRVVVALDPAQLDASLIQAAARWSYWLREAMHAEGLNRVPDLDVVFMNSEGAAPGVPAVLEREPASLIVVPLQALTVRAKHERAVELMSYLLERAHAPVLLLSPTQAPPWAVDLQRDAIAAIGARKAVSLIG